MGVDMVTWLFKNFAVCGDAARRVGSSATAELLVSTCIVLSHSCETYYVNAWWHPQTIWPYKSEIGPQQHIKIVAHNFQMYWACDWSKRKHKVSLRLCLQYYSIVTQSSCWKSERRFAARHLAVSRSFYTLMYTASQLCRISGFWALKSATSCLAAVTQLTSQ